MTTPHEHRNHRTERRDNAIGLAAVTVLLLTAVLALGLVPVLL